MKKIFSTLLIVAVSTIAMAAVQDRARLTITGKTTGHPNNMTLLVYDAATTPGESGVLYEGGDFSGSPSTTYIYAVDGTKHYQILKANAIADQAIGFGTVDETEYIISVDNVITGSTAFKLYDKVTDQTHTLVDGYSFEITAAANSRIEDRFVINPSATQTEFVCQVPAGLSFHGDQDYTGLQVLDENDNVIEAAFDLAAGEDKVVAIATAGRYYVLNGTQKIFFVVR